MLFSTYFSATPQRQAFREGFAAIGVMGFAIAIWGLVTGVAMAKSSLTLGQAAGMSLLVFAGSAQLASLPILAAHMPLWVLWLTATIVNLRFVIFSVGLQPHFKDRPFWQRMSLGYLNGDLGFMLFQQRFPQADGSPLRLPYFLGIAFGNWLFWQIGSFIGIFLASQIPNHWGVGFAGTLALIALVLPVVKHGSALAAALTAAVVAVLAHGLPFKLNILLAVLAAIAVGITFDKYHARQSLTQAGAEGTP